MRSRVPSDRLRVLPYPPGILARGPWPLDRVTSCWSETPTSRPPDKVAAADRAIAELKAAVLARRTTDWPARLAELHRC